MGEVTAPHVVGVDLSLTGTGIATADGELTVRTNAADGFTSCRMRATSGAAISLYCMPLACNSLTAFWAAARLTWRW